MSFKKNGSLKKTFRKFNLMPKEKYSTEIRLEQIIENARV